jgi:uroporphyrinogen-III decarboxylase
MDYSRHNQEVKLIWDTYQAGRPVRVPMLLTSVARIWVLDPALNTTGITWQEYLSDPHVMLDVSLKHKYYVAHTIPQDWPMGVPEDAWDIHLEFGNVYEEAWFGCEIVYPENQIATTRPQYSGPEKHAVFERGLPGPFDGFMARVLETYETILDAAKERQFHDRPINILHPIPLSTDGPLTVANGIRGTEIFEDMLLDEVYYHQLMDFITTAIVARIRAWRTYLNIDPKPEKGWFADDAVQFLSPRVYCEKVLPYHRRLLDELYGQGPHSIHLCGNVQRLLPIFKEKLNFRSFDTGFPINFTTLRDEIGDEVEIQGGVPVGELVHHTPQAIFQRTRAILQSGIKRGGRFILKEANDLAPCTPLANLQAMYEAVKTYGMYSSEPISTAHQPD